jgi:hypothetical protein
LSTPASSRPAKAGAHEITEPVARGNEALHDVLLFEATNDSLDRTRRRLEVIANHFTEAGLDDLAIEWWGKAGDQALRRSAFQEAIAHLGKAIAMADKAGGLSCEGQRLARWSPKISERPYQTNFYATTAPSLSLITSTSTFPAARAICTM